MRWVSKLLLYFQKQIKIHCTLNLQMKLFVLEKVLQLKDEEIANKQATNNEQERRIAEANATLQQVEAKTAELSAAMARDAPVEELAALHRELDALVLQTSKNLPSDFPPPPERGELSESEDEEVGVDAGVEEEKDDPSPRSDE